MKYLFLLFIFATLATSALAQERAMTYAEANPGILTVTLDLRSDSAHLRSYIGEFTPEEAARLKAFVNSSFVRENRFSKEKYGHHNRLLMDSLTNVLDRPIETCTFTAGSVQVCTFNTPLENEVIKPLIVLVKQNHHVCQMADGGTIRSPKRLQTAPRNR